MSDVKEFLLDCIEALRLVRRLSWQRNLTAWLYVPIGIMVILLACFGVNTLIGLSSVSFPASVAVLILLFLALLISDYCVGNRATKSLVNIIDIPAGFALRYINIFFTPSFVLLPLSPPISGVEVGKIIAVFLIGFVVMFAATAYIVRGLQMLFGTTKRALHERAEEMGNEQDDIPLTARSMPASTLTLNTPGSVTPPAADSAAPSILPPQRTQDPSLVRGTGGPPESPQAPIILPPASISQTPLPLTRPQRWAFFVNTNFDRLTYSLILLCVALPLYYTTSYAMPAHLTINVLAYFAANAIPPAYKRFLHPVLVSSLITVLSIWVLGLTTYRSLSSTLAAYKTGTNYLVLWHGEKTHLLPGAGDIFASVLDASIVALALPMYAYRHELSRHFLTIILPNVSISIGSLFGYPALCHALGISSTRSLAFAARSLTLALATPSVKNLGGDLNTVAALAIMSGILGVLIGPWLLKKLYIPEDDYLTRGITLGTNSSAIATALLLVSDPRAAALSSLSMSVFGIVTLTLSSIPVVVRVVGTIAGL